MNDQQAADSKREALARTMWDSYLGYVTRIPWEQAPAYKREGHLRQADAILAIFDIAPTEYGHSEDFKPEAEPLDPEVQAVWDGFWKGIVAPDGVLDLDQVKRELFDYHMLLQEVPLVYDHVTFGRVSKPNTLASVVISLSNDLFSEAVEERVAEVLAEREEGA